VILTKQELEEEIEEKGLDLQAFMQARDIIRKRVMEVSDSVCKLTPLPAWSGTDAVLGSLDLSIHAIERTLAELQGELMNLIVEVPKLRLVKEGEDEHQG
jgi:hypothetical protein